MSIFRVAHTFRVIRFCRWAARQRRTSGLRHNMSKPPNHRSGSTRSRARLGENGMSLLELMIAMAVLAVGLMGSMIMILTAMESNSRSKTDNYATILDQEIMEKFATLNNYPKAGSVTIYDCALNGSNVDSHLASLR